MQKYYKGNGGISTMDKRTVRKIVEEYANLVVKNMIVNKIVLYGSYARRR